jgi:hypothetical protein
MYIQVLRAKKNPNYAHKDLKIDRKNEIKCL